MIRYSLLGKAGRLGNQLWEIASTVGLALKHGDVPAFPRWEYEPFFCVPESYFYDVLPEGVDVVSMVPHLGEAGRFLQDYSLFESIQDEIRAMFAPSKLAWTELLRSRYEGFFALEPPVLAIQVRRGDNVPENDPMPDKHLYHPLRPLSYYEEAIDSLEGVYSSVAVFSDDIPWCREHFKADWYSPALPRPAEYDPSYASSPRLDWVDVALMALADYHIIGNSSFGWWGAFLSADPAPRYPSPWYGPNLAHLDASLMFPSNWVRIEHAPC